MLDVLERASDVPEMPGLLQRCQSCQEEYGGYKGRMTNVSIKKQGPLRPREIWYSVILSLIYVDVLVAIVCVYTYLSIYIYTIRLSYIIGSIEVVRSIRRDY